eukprot:1162092-Pelagomonas_calceolata.AAC.9
MDTSFHYDLAEKNLNFKLRERLVARPGIELKGKGLFNTVTGNLSYAGTLRGVLKTRPEVKDEGSLPWKLGELCEGSYTLKSDETILEGDVAKP